MTLRAEARHRARNNNKNNLWVAQGSNRSPIAAGRVRNLVPSKSSRQLEDSEEVLTTSKLQTRDRFLPNMLAPKINSVYHRKFQSNCKAGQVSLGFYICRTSQSFEESGISQDIVRLTLGSLETLCHAIEVIRRSETT